METLYERVGGSAFFERLVDRFYDGVANDPELLALYPDADDLRGPRRRLTLFLIQYWGGPTTYSDERGHPRLRLRHAPFAIDSAARDRWLTHMRAALVEAINEGLASGAADELWGYFVPVADGMRNRAG
jgi:hemoglobin